MSLVSPPSEPKLMTVPVRSANRSATSPSRRPPTLSIATWILAPSAAARTRSFQPPASVAKTGDPGKAQASFAALSFASDQSDDLYAPLRQNLADEAPDSGPAPVSSMTTPVRASGGGESCAARITVRAVTVLISICAPTSSGDRVRQRHDRAGRIRRLPRSKRQLAGKKATLRPSLNPRAGSTVGADLAHNAGAFKSGHPPAGADRRRCSERWRSHDAEKIAWMDRRVGQPDANLIWPSE